MKAGQKETQVNKMKFDKRKPKPKEKDGYKKTPNKNQSCKFCGKTHAMKKEECPAWEKTCENCHGRNHFKIKCKKSAFTRRDGWRNLLLGLRRLVAKRGKESER